MRHRPSLLPLVLVAALGAIAPASAWARQTGQQAHHEGIGIGVKLGPVFNSATDSVDKHGLKKRTGMMYSLFLGGNRPGIMGVATELTLIQRKFEVEKDVDTPGGTIETTFFEVPVLLRVNAGSHTLSGVSAYVLVGPSFDFRLKAETTLPDIGTGFKDKTQAVNVGLIVGGGVEITRFIIEGRYTKELRSLFSDKGATDLQFKAGETVKQKSFMLLFGIRFN
jgi:hypothetical protein